MNIYVGGLSQETAEVDLKKEFETYGKVSKVVIITDKYTGLSRGFAFIEMPVDEEAKAAISGLNGKELKGKNIIVNQARPRNDNRGRRFNKDNRRNRSRFRY